jgi:hypothetical protein
MYANSENIKREQRVPNMKYIFLLGGTAVLIGCTTPEFEQARYECDQIAQQTYPKIYQNVIQKKHEQYKCPMEILLATQEIFKKAEQLDVPYIEQRQSAKKGKGMREEFTMRSYP